MYRTAINKLKEWKFDSNKKPLIFLGARQVGKTWLIKEFGKTEYHGMEAFNGLLPFASTFISTITGALVSF